MEKLNKHDTKVLIFLAQINNVYRDEEKREECTKLELKEEELTNDFTAMLQALHIFYQKITSDEVDLIGFTHILNRLAIQHLMEPKNGYDKII
jgi:hypothetical protein